MMRERLIPLALATSALLVAASCTTDDSAGSSTSGDATTTTEPGDVTSTEPPGSAPSTTTGSGPQGFASANLEFFGDCDALLSYMQTEASERVTAWGLGGGGIYYGDGRMMPEGDMAATDAGANAEIAPDVAPAPGAVEGQDFSGTNTQEVGVDEGDIVETDGEYVYVANSDGLRIVSVGDADVVGGTRTPGGFSISCCSTVTASWS